AVDSSGSGNDAAYVNNPTLGQSGALAGVTGTSASFDGATQYVQLSSSAFGSYGSPLSFEVWFNAPVGSSGVILSQTGGGANPGGGGPAGWVPVIQLGTDGKLRSSMFWHGDVNARVVSPGATTYNDGQWHHVAVTYDGASESLYIDGAAVGQRAVGD